MSPRDSKPCLRATLNQNIDLVLLFNPPSNTASRRSNRPRRTKTARTGCRRARLAVAAECGTGRGAKYDYRPHGRRG